MKKILLIGESCIDEYIYGTCDRVCPEAPALCFKSNGEVSAAGGMVQNVLVNMQSLSPDSEIDVFTNHSSIIKRRFVDYKYNSIVFRHDESDSCPRINIADHSFSGYDACIISDYCKGFLSESDIEYIISHVDAGAPKFIDTKKPLRPFIKGVYFIKINKQEHKNNIDNMEQLLSYCHNLIVTCGDKGALHFSRGMPIPFVHTTSPVDVRDVCGAGDTFLAAFVIRYIEIKDIPSSISWANQCAGKVVRKFGVTTP